MNKINRPPAPDWLEEGYEQWGIEWKEKYERTGKSASFTWRGNKNKGYHDLLHELSLMTKDHCSFCDAFPMGGRIPKTIEHFRPKTKFYLLAYKWSNLFLCCGNCQKKGDRFDENLLKPDEDDYSFDEYFLIEWDTGKLIPNGGKSVESQERARITIELYRLNEDAKPEDRLRELEHFTQSDSPDLDEWAYRFFLERG